MAVMTLGRLVGLLLVAVVLFAIINRPLDSAAMVRDGMSGLASAGTSVIQFMSAVRLPHSTGSGSGASTASRTTDTYTVRRGDTLSSIAADHGTTTGEIASRNGIADPSMIMTGRHLVLP